MGRLDLYLFTCFEHYLLILRRRYTNGTWYIACVLCQLAAPGLEELQSWWMKSASRWFHYTDILWCTVNKTLSLISVRNQANLHSQMYRLKIQDWRTWHCASITTLRNVGNCNDTRIFTKTSRRTNYFEGRCNCILGVGLWLNSLTSPCISSCST
jgi:hypothetical protein